eukprot:scaffold35246_cov252-Amphora_coffeaeformis.AAC.2
MAWIHHGGGLPWGRWLRSFQCVVSLVFLSSLNALDGCCVTCSDCVHTMVVHSIQIIPVATKRNITMLLLFLPSSALDAAAAIHMRVRNILSARISNRIPTRDVCCKARAKIPSNKSNAADTHHRTAAVVTASSSLEAAVA